MSILSWDSPKKKMSKEEWSSLCADSAPPGVYTPNMSDEDCLKWRAKLIKGDHPRVEIRTSSCDCLLVVIVLKDGYYPKDKDDERWCKMPKDHPYYKDRVRISANGPIHMTWRDWENLKSVVEEAGVVLEKL